MQKPKNEAPPNAKLPSHWVSAPANPYPKKAAKSEYTGSSNRRDKFMQTQKSAKHLRWLTAQDK